MPFEGTGATLITMLNTAFMSPVHRRWLTASLLNSLVALPVHAQSGDAAARTLSFDSLMYAMFASPYPDLSRNFTTSTPQAASNLLRLRLRPPAPNDYKLLGTWTTTQALVERAVRQNDTRSPAALLLYTRSTPRPPASAEQGTAIAILVGRWSGTPAALASYEGQLDRASFNRRSWATGTIFSSCNAVNIVVEDYPLLRRAVHRSCEAQYRTQDTFLKVNVVNLDEQRAVMELQRAAAAFGLVGGK